MEVAQPVHTSVIIHTRYEHGARWAPSVLSAANGALVLLDNTLVARERPEFALETLSRVMGTATAFEGVRGDATPTARAILALVQQAHVAGPGRLNEARSP